MLTNLAEVQNQIQSYWAPVFTQELRESLLLASLVNKDYEGAISQQGDTVYVSQVNAPEGQLLTVGTDADSFQSEKLTTTRIAIQANKRAVASFKFADLVSLQSQISAEKSEVRESLMYAVAKQMNDYLYSLVAPSESAPDHAISGGGDFNAAKLAECRTLAAKAKWRKLPGWYGLLDPQYYGDILNATTMVSSDYGATDAPTISGQVAMKRLGFNLLEDNSRDADYGLIFHPDFLHMVMQKAVQVKISDLHPLGQFGVLLSVDMVFGAAQGIDGDKKHIVVSG